MGESKNCQESPREKMRAASGACVGMGGTPLPLDLPSTMHAARLSERCGGPAWPGVQPPSWPWPPPALSGSWRAARLSSRPSSRPFWPTPRASFPFSPSSFSPPHLFLPLSLLFSLLLLTTTTTTTTYIHYISTVYHIHSTYYSH